MPQISYSRTRESDALMEKRLREAAELSKQDTLIKFKEAQVLPVEHLVTPDVPIDPNEAAAMQFLVIKGPLNVAEMANLMRIGELMAESILNGLTAGDNAKATKSLEGDKWVYRLRHKVVKTDHPYKGKRPAFKDKPTITKVMRDDGMEDWVYTLEYKEEVI